MYAGTLAPSSRSKEWHEHVGWLISYQAVKC